MNDTHFIFNIKEISTNFAHLHSGSCTEFSDLAERKVDGPGLEWTLESPKNRWSLVNVDGSERHKVDSPNFLRSVHFRERPLTKRSTYEKVFQQAEQFLEMSDFGWDEFMVMDVIGSIVRYWIKSKSNLGVKIIIRIL